MEHGNVLPRIKAMVKKKKKMFLGQNFFNIRVGGKGGILLISEKFLRNHKS